MKFDGLAVGQVWEDDKYPAATDDDGIKWTYEITKIVDFFFQSKALSLMFQPITFTGKSLDLEMEKNRITIPDVINKIERNKHVKKEDFNPVPCSHFSCFAISYYLIVENGSFISLKDFIGKDKFYLR